MRAGLAEPQMRCDAGGLSVLVIVGVCLTWDTDDNQLLLRVMMFVAFRCGSEK